LSVARWINWTIGHSTCPPCKTPVTNDSSTSYNVVYDDNDDFEDKNANAKPMFKKTKARFSCLLWHPAWKWSGTILV